MDEASHISKHLRLNRSGMQVLMTQIKCLQGSYHIFTVFDQEMKTLFQQQKMQQSQDLDFDPEILNMYNMARSYQKFISNPHPYPHQLKELAAELGAASNIYLEVQILERFLHAVDKINPNFYQNPLHKQEVAQVILQTLEDLYDEIEEIEEEDDDQGEYLL